MTPILRDLPDADVAVLLRLVGIPEDDIAILQREVAHRRDPSFSGYYSAHTLGGVVHETFTRHGMNYHRRHDWQRQAWARSHARRAAG